MRIGEKIGEIEIIDILGYHIEPNGHKRRLVKVKCSCGFIWEIPYNSLKRNKSGRCKRCSNQLVRKGQIFGDLTVIGYTKDIRSLVICKCVCGNIINTRAELLIKNKTNHCGCKPIGSYKGYEELSQTFFGRIERNASIRGIQFDLEKQDLWKLFLTQNKKCALSGVDISIKFNGSGNASLDRIDSSKHYTINNVQWVHKDINKMKMDFDQEYFLKMCKLVSDNNHG